MTTSILKKIDEACVLVRQGEYLKALTAFGEIYGTSDSPPLTNPKAAGGLSYYALCVALVQKNHKGAIDLCKRAIDLEFYNGDHYANLTRVYTSAGNRKKAIETAEAGLKILPDHDELKKARKELGVRARPTVPFLDRANPINVTLGQSRRAKEAEKEQVKKIPASRSSQAPRRPSRGGKGR